MQPLAIALPEGKIKVRLVDGFTSAYRQSVILDKNSSLGACLQIHAAHVLSRSADEYLIRANRQDDPVSLDDILEHDDLITIMPTKGEGG